MKRIKWITLYFLATIIVMNIPFYSMADTPTISDFSFSAVSTLNNEESTLNVQITISGPEAEASKVSGIFSSITVDGISLGCPVGVGSNINACKTGEAGYVSAQDMTALIFCTASITEGVPNGMPVTFSLNYDVSGKNIHAGSKVMVSIPKSGVLATWNGAVARDTAGKELISCTISSSGDSISSSAVPEEDITNSAIASVTSSISDGTATLNVACDKACVVAYTTDEGKTYTRVNATKADSGYDFVVPDYSEDMKFVVAVKGDVSGDAKLDAEDYGALVASYLGTGTLSSLNTVVGDVNADSKINAEDYGALVAAYLGTGTIAW